MSGANFYISVKQVLENEKKVRALTLLQSDLLKDVILKDSDSVVLSDVSGNGSLLLSAPSLDATDVENLDSGDLNSVLYVAGYVGRSIARERKCASCKTLLVSQDNVEKDISEKCNFFTMLIVEDSVFLPIIVIQFHALLLFLIINWRMIARPTQSS